MIVNEQTRVRLILRGDITDPKDPNVITKLTLGEFFAANDFDDIERRLITQTLASGGVWVTGGGAAPVYSLDLESPAFFTDPFEGQWRFAVQCRDAYGWRDFAHTLDRETAEKECAIRRERFPNAEYRIRPI